MGTAITTYTPHHEPSPPSSSGPTTHYLAVSSSSSSSTNAVIVRHRRHRRHHGVGCCLVPPATIVILILVVHRRRNPTNDSVPAALPCPSRDPHPPVKVAPSPPSRSPMAPSWTGMRRQRPWSDGVSATPARAPLVGRRAHCASAAVTTAAMPRSPLRRPAVDPPLLLGPPPPVGRRRRQYGGVDARPWQPGATMSTP